MRNKWQGDSFNVKNQEAKIQACTLRHERWSRCQGKFNCVFMTNYNKAEALFCTLWDGGYIA